MLFTALLVTLFNRDKHLAGRYITYVVVIMFILPFGAVAPNLLVADQLKREDKRMLNQYRVFTSTSFVNSIRLYLNDYKRFKRMKKQPLIMFFFSLRLPIK